MRQILCLSNVNWSKHPTRTQQLLSRISQASVLFFEPSRSQSSFGGRKVRPNILAYTLPGTLSIGADTTLVSSYNCRHIASAIDKAMARHRFRDPLLWCTSPQDVRLLDYLSYHGIVYDCQQYWNDLPIQWEGELASSADLCFAASPGLVRRLSPCNTNIVLLPNGVNLPLFHRESSSAPPYDISDLQGQIVLGFVGSLTDDLNITPLLRCAKVHPEWTFLMLGPVSETFDLHVVRQYRNIRVLGPRPLVEIPDYLNSCAVCLHMLYRRDKGSDVVPSRIYEYLAMGKPIVSMLWQRQSEAFPEIIYYARSNNEFVVQCQRAVNEKSGIMVHRRQECGRKSAWSERSCLISQLLDDNGL